MKEMNVNEIIRLLKKCRTLGLVGNANTAKTSLVLTLLIKLKKQIKNIPIYVYGVDINLHHYLESLGIIILRNREDILDLRIKDCIIYIDEFGDFFDSKVSSRQGDKLMRFFNRIYHLNDYLIVSTARQNFYNKIMEGVIKGFIVKSVDFDQLVRGTNLLRRVKGMETNSDYRLECKTSDFYVLGENLTEKYSFEYNVNLDSKKDNIDIFSMYEELESESESEIKSEEKSEDYVVENGKEYKVNPFNLPVEIPKELNKRFINRENVNKIGEKR